MSLGVEFITGEAVDFDTDQNGQINSIKVWNIKRIPTKIYSEQLIFLYHFPFMDMDEEDQMAGAKFVEYFMTPY